MKDELIKEYKSYQKALDAEAKKVKKEQGQTLAAVAVAPNFAQFMQWLETGEL